ncbi:hypothetical protein, partial [Massilia phosphatilytica]
MATVTCSVITDATPSPQACERRQIYFHRGSTEDELDKIVHWSLNRHLTPSQFTIRTNDYKAPNYQGNP